MKRSIAVVYVFGLFLLGTLIGALGMHLYHAHAPSAIHPPGGWAEGRPGMQGGGMQRFVEQLELTDDQEREIRAILDESRREAREMHEEMLPRVHELMQRTHERIAELLTPDQRERLQTISRHRRSLEMLFLGHGPPDHRPLRGKGRGAGGPPAE